MSGIVLIIVELTKNLPDKITTYCIILKYFINIYIKKKSNESTLGDFSTVRSAVQSTMVIKTLTNQSHVKIIQQPQNKLIN